MRISPTAIISTDLFANLAIVFMVTLSTVSALVKEDVLVKVEARKTELQTDRSAVEGPGVARLTVSLNSAGYPSYLLKLDGRPTQVLVNHQSFLEALQQNRPTGLQVRMDRRVPSGYLQDINLDVRNGLKIPVWQVNTKG